MIVVDVAADSGAGPRSEGGDPVCWIDHLCAACGRLIGDDASVCPSCGAGRDEDLT